MEGIGSEVSHKIRAAIKAKLIELRAYVDDELPDYIMVMVANKRTRSQMDDDLQLFLGTNTKIFTSWLHTVLQKLQEVTVANFDGKKDSDGKKPGKRKRSVSAESQSKIQKSDEAIKASKKHSKRHKDSKRAKKNKHKNKDKAKSKSSGKKKTRDESDDEKSSKSVEKDGSDALSKGNRVVVGSSQNDEKSEKKTKDKKDGKEKKLLLNDVVGKAILGSLKDNERRRNEKIDLSASKPNTNEDKISRKEIPAKENGNVATEKKQDSGCADDDVLNIKADDEHCEDEEGSNQMTRSRTEVVEDEFNIEPLKPTEKVQDVLGSENTKNNKNKLNNHSNLSTPVEPTISAPTKELLKEHDKLLSQVEEEEADREKVEEEEKREDSDSELSLSPEEIRKQLLLSRAKKKLEESKLAERMRSNSPDVLILEQGANKAVDKPKESSPLLRSSRIQEGGDQIRRSPVVHRPQKFSSKSSYSSDYRSASGSPIMRKVDINREPKLTIIKSSNDEEGRKVSISRQRRGISPITFKKDSSRRNQPASTSRTDKKKNVISISKSLEMEKNLGIVVKRESDRKGGDQSDSSKKKPVPSRVVTIPEPEVPEISSIVKVKPREYISKDKQANKALILKAVADAEKSIAIVHSRNDGDSEARKPEALFTKNLRGKKYEKLAVTLSNVRKSPDSRDRVKRMISVDSENSEAENKADSLRESDASRKKSDLTLKKIAKKSEDQFISSKTSAMEKNDKYIHCWLEGVQKAVNDEGMVNPDEMENLNQPPLTDEEVEMGESSRKGDKKKTNSMENSSSEEGIKGGKLSEKEIANLRLIPNCPSTDGGPQIVVTLDGLNSKTIKEILLRNREKPSGPLLSSATSKKTNENSKEIKYVGEKIDANIKIIHKNSDPSKEGGTSGIRDKDSPDTKKFTFEKISDRFGRINRTSENHEYKEKYYEFERERYEKKYLKYQGTDKERYYEKLRDKYVSGESKNKKLIAQLSEKFGKVDREFDNRKRKYREEDRRYSHPSRRNDKDLDRDGKYRKVERKSLREVATDYEDLQRLKSKERCLFWPGCSKGTNCEYHHPSSPCKLLPNCKYKEKCMYIHPICKNDQHCHDKDCPYEHTSKESSSKKISPPPTKSSSQICKFYPNCKNLECRYFHPKKCRYDEDCTNVDCKYVHSDHSQKKRSKWSNKS